MKRGISQIVLLIVAVLIAGALILVGFNVVKKISTGTGEIWEKGEEYRKKMEGVADVVAACEGWYSQGYNGNVKVLATYKLPEKMALFPNLYEECGRGLENLISTCSDPARASSDTNCYGVNKIHPGAEDFQKCIRTCDAIRLVAKRCEECGGENAQVCIISYVDFAGSGITDTAYLTEILQQPYLQRACRGKLFDGSCKLNDHPDPNYSRIAEDYPRMYPNGFDLGNYICRDGTWEELNP